MRAVIPGARSAHPGYDKQKNGRRSARFCVSHYSHDQKKSAPAAVISKVPSGSTGGDAVFNATGTKVKAIDMPNITECGFGRVSVLTGSVPRE